jgi:hypothetical protein
MIDASRAPAQSPSSAVRGRLFARVVLQWEAPLCPMEAELQQRGAHVTRLLAAELLPQPAIDQPTFRLLGRLYDGLIVPRTESFRVDDIVAAAGVPVVSEDQISSALRI